LVASAAPPGGAVREASWIAGPALWIVTALGAGLVLRGLARWRLSWRARGVATLVGGAADALVVAAGRPWLGLVAGVSVFVLATTACGRSADVARC
jgi:hypothetical protein